MFLSAGLPKVHSYQNLDQSSYNNFSSFVNNNSRLHPPYENM
jgi:hypothetical protein